MGFSTLPISDQIDANVLSTLQGVKTTGGYQVTLSSVVFADPFGETSPSDLLCVIHVGDDEEVPDDDTPLSHKQWRRSYAVQVFIAKNVADLAATRFETWKNVIRADIEKALMVDVSRGNVAQNTEIHNPVTFEDANEVKGVFVIFDVVYRTLWSDPYNQ